MDADLAGKDYISTADWSKEELEALLALAGDLKDRFKRSIPHRLLADRTLFMIFFDKSTRTRNAMEAGMTQLGGHAHYVDAGTSQISHGETVREVLGSGGRVLTLLNLSDVYMEIFLPSAQAHRVSIGSPARIKLDILDVAVPAKVSFVSPKSQFTPKQVETPSEREKLMFRVKVRVPQELVLQYIDQVKTGIRGVAYVPLGVDPKPEWPDFLQNLPPEPDTAASTGK